VNQHRLRGASLAVEVAEAGQELLSWLHGSSKAKASWALIDSQTCQHLQLEEAL
jgi:hypothetical protein